MNEFLVVVQNMVMVFHNFDIFFQLLLIFDLSSALAYRVESTNMVNMNPVDLCLD